MLVSEFSEYVPSIIITSDATRVLDTVECFSVAEPDAFGKTTVILAPEFYEVAHGSDVKAKRIRKAIMKKIKREGADGEGRRRCAWSGTTPGGRTW